MTVTLVDGPLTAHAVLFDGDGGEAARKLGAGLPTTLTGLDRGALSESARRAMHQDFADVAAGLLDLDLGGVLVTGWCKHAQLGAAAERTLAAPGSRETVRLAEHRISHTSSPHVDVLLGGTVVTQIKMTLGVDVDVTGLEASIREGRLVSLHSGDAAITVALAVEGAPVARSKPITLRLPIDLALGEGLRLVS